MAETDVDVTDVTETHLVETVPDETLLPWTWPRLIAVTGAKALIATLLGLAMWGALPAAIGWHPTTVSSGSMLPRLHVGDVAVSRPLDGTTPALGTVLLYDDPDHHGRLRMHRFIRVDDDGLLVTKGDANPDEDSSHVSLGAVLGIGTLRVPWIALPIVWIREGRWVPLGLVVAALGVALVTALAGHDRGFPDEPDEADDEPGEPDEHDEGPEPAAAGTSPWSAPHPTGDR